MGMNHLERVAELLDDIDASVFSGDVFHNRDGIELLELYVGRWAGALEQIKEIVAECESNEEGDEEWTQRVKNAAVKWLVMVLQW